MNKELVYPRNQITDKRKKKLMCRVDTDMKSGHLLSSAQFMLNCVADVQNICKIIQYSAHILLFLFF